ncbi:MAG: hypothetical protein HPY66_3273 [Firmicutes bacterium]|nr:hypothetical protein [Bacillota bacterium]MDI6706203.1 aspartate aminotransferase family protein [Bacillota bacterium]
MNDAKLKHILNLHPVVHTEITRAENTALFTADGRKMVDFEAGIWCTALGHTNARINAVIEGQISRIMHTSFRFTGNIAETCAANLLQVLDLNNGKAVFLSSGSEAVELSLRIARMISDKRYVLSFSNSYLSAYSSFSSPRDKRLWMEIDFEKCSSCKNKECFGKCNALEGIDFGEISAFVLEPGSTSGRVLFPPYKLVSFLAGEVRKNGGSVVINEVTTGFGRTGKWFGHNHYDLKPDIAALGKALGNGYPVSAVAVSGDIANRLEEKNLRYVQSHQNDPLGCSIANEVINILRDENLIERSESVGLFFMDRLKEIRDSCPIVKGVRGRGLMLAVELNIRDATEIVFEKMLQHGYLIGTTPAWNVLRFYPALTIAEDDIVKMCSSLKKVLNGLV